MPAFEFLDVASFNRMASDTSPACPASHSLHLAQLNTVIHERQRGHVDRVELVCGDESISCERGLLAGVLVTGALSRVSVTHQMLLAARQVVRGPLGERARK